jgi:hypothetical protein
MSPGNYRKCILFPFADTGKSKPGAKSFLCNREEEEPDENPYPLTLRMKKSSPSPLDTVPLIDTVPLNGK